MFEELRDKLIGYICNRLTLFTVVFACLAAILIYRCFDLQIVHGQEYQDNFLLSIEKTKELAGTRGNIYDCNGNLLAYNELAYSVKLEDVFENDKYKNQKMNDTILNLIRIIEKRGDQISSSDLKIMIDEDGAFAFTVDGTQKLRFLADIYGKKSVDLLEDEERRSSALDIMNYLSGKKQFAVGQYAEPGNQKSDFLPGYGYSYEDWLKVVSIRYSLKLTGYRKYIGTIVAKAVSESTVAAVMENSDVLPGVTIEEDTVRRYVDNKYFAHVLGYTGKISSSELTELNEKMAAEGYNQDMYSMNDVVGKSGIESYMETTLQGHKGYEKVVVNNVGKVILVEEREEPSIGKDVYLTIDMELTKAIYNIIEQKLAGMVSEKIIDAKEYVAGTNSKSSDIKIPIYDVYYAMFNNSILDLKLLSSEEAGEAQQTIFAAHESYKASVYDKLIAELYEKGTPYDRLSKEYQVYQSNMVSLLYKNNILMSDVVDTGDATYIAWTTDETISMAEFLRYSIAKNWVDVSKLELDDQYSDSDETYNKLVDAMLGLIDNNQEFQKKLYKYMLLDNVISPRQVCMALCEQGIISIPEEDVQAFYDGKLSAYRFMKNRIDRLEITPAQLALDPCNASVVLVDCNTGKVKAMVTYPGYDNNKMANSIDPEYYAKLTTDKSSPLYNFATQYKGAPGSTFKMVSATAGLMENVIDLEDTIYCKGTFTEITPSPKCWKTYGHGPETVVSAIKDSCNYFFYNVGYSFATRNGSYNAAEGLDTLAKYADLFGLTDKSGVEISEAAPQVSDNDPVRSAIGQGTHSYTTAAIARYVATVANNGTCYNLSLLDKVTDASGSTLKEYYPEIRNTIDLPQEYWNALHSGMRKVVEGKKYYNDLGVNVAGKTGTAEQTKSRPNHALFVCYAPYESPEISIATRIPFGYSSDYAAQVTRDIIKYYYDLADEDDLITGTANSAEGGISNEM